MTYQLNHIRMGPFLNSFGWDFFPVKNCAKKPNLKKLIPDLKHALASDLGKKLLLTKIMLFKIFSSAI